MSFRSYLFLFLIGLAVPIFIAQYQPIPGYLDSDYYFAGGIQLATGKGFTEPYLWNYLDGATSLPHPSHSYWMPLASIVAALGMWLTGQTTYASARIFFFIIAALVPPLTAALAFTFSKRRDLAITSGILAVFCVYNAPFLGVTDNFGIFMLLGVLYFLAATQILKDSTRARNWFALGLLAGLLNLSRTDGLLWLGIAFIFVVFRAALSPITNYELRITNRAIRNSILVLLGFLLIMSPWYIRNLNLYGTLMSPGGSRVLWLGEYDQTFTYPPALLTVNSFLALGWQKIIAERISALGTNLMSGFAAHGGIVPFPFIVAGIIYYRKDERVKLAVIAWLILFLAMSFIFPFAGKRGAFFHAGAALQPMWWALAPLGLESILVSLRKRGIGNDQNRFIFRSLLVMITIILTVYVINLKLFVIGWSEGEEKYPAVEQLLVEKGIKSDDLVIISNAPGYYLETGRSAIALPYGGAKAIRAVSDQFGARYLVLGSKNLQDQFIYLGEVNGEYVYKINK